MEYSNQYREKYDAIRGQIRGEPLKIHFRRGENRVGKAFLKQIAQLDSKHV